MQDSSNSIHAKALSAAGAAKGGRARALSLSQEERQEIARKAADARWGKNPLPVATHTGQLDIGGTLISCAVLENGQRLLTQETFLTAIGRAAKAKGGTGSARLLKESRALGGLPPFLAAENLKEFVKDDLLLASRPIEFRSPEGRKAFGYEAKLLPLVCEVYLRARDAKKILKAQERIVSQCDLLMRGFAQVGIIALVDEATGYQDVRTRDELAKILEMYISEELRPWIKMFPDEFFKQIFRLHNWTYRPGTTKKPPYVGKLINRWIYEQLPPGVLDELRAKNPVTTRGYRRHKHHQYLTADTGNIHLDKQITTVTTLMRVADDKQEFERLFSKAFARPYQQPLPLVVAIPGNDN